MHRRLFLAACLPICCPIWSAQAASHRPRVIASCSILADMVRQIGGDSVTVESLVPIDADAHGYQPRPGDARAVAAADMVVMNGLGFDDWVGRLTKSAGFRGGMTITTTGLTPTGLTPMPGGTLLDPHAWQDPRNGAVYATNIAIGLAATDPTNAALYRAAGDRYRDEILRLDSWIEAQFAAIPPSARRIVTTHDAFGYFGARYGITFLAAQGMSTEAEPSARAMAALIAQIKREAVKTVFIENMANPRLAHMLTRETGAVLGGTVYSDALSGPDGPAPTYLSMLRHNTMLFTAAMAASTPARSP